MLQGIQCSCGRRVLAADVVQRNWYARVFGPSFMYLRFRCPGCRRVGERFIEQDQWNDTLLRESGVEVSPGEQSRFAALGRITVDEAIDFHFELERPDALRRAQEEGGRSEA